MIGSISIWNMDNKQEGAELGCGIIPEYQNRGFMKEALLRVVNYGFEVMNLKTLDAYTEEKNMSSIKLLENCNFIEVDRVDDEGYFSERMYHMVVFRLKNAIQ